jgi:phosphoribosyl-AMP cyclohydrolase
MDWLDHISFNADGLVPVITQEASSGDVLMFAWMNREALTTTARTGQAVYYSRSRQKLWRKGEESGHFQSVHSIRTDCDSDVLLLTVTQHGHEPGIACHTGRHSCFFQQLQPLPGALPGASPRASPRASAQAPEGLAWQTTAPVLKEPNLT